MIKFNRLRIFPRFPMISLIDSMQLGLIFLQQDLQTATCTKTGATFWLPDPRIKAYNYS